jgi:SAM-dependent methyltransferase
LSIDPALLTRLLRENPFQPATGVWRAVELGAVLRHGLPRGRGLDLGCGDGKLMRILLDASAGPGEVVGVDIDPLETRDAVRMGVYLRVHTASGAQIPEPDATFDFVFSNSVLEHIEEIEPVIREVARVLRPGGTFLYTVPSPGFHACLAGPLAPWVDRAAYLAEIDRRCAHRRYWGERDWDACLRRHGLLLTRSLEYLSAPEVRRWESASRFTAGVLFSVFGGRRSPIEIQRSLGLRRRKARLPLWLAATLARVLAAGLETDHPGRFGGLLVEALRSGAKGETP